MRITYYALRPIQVGGDIREPGDLVPEAASWQYLSGYLADGKIAPVLVATLPEEQQVMLLEWEEAMIAEATGHVPTDEGGTKDEAKDASKAKEPTPEKVK